MANFDSGVKRFIEGGAYISVRFPVDWDDRPSVCCVQCPYLSDGRRMCQLNKQPVQYPNKFIGYDCPLIFKKIEDPL